MDRAQLHIDPTRIKAFCQRWNLRELSIFGSAVRNEMGSNSDIDILVELAVGRFPDVDEWDAMIAELTALLGRGVDLISKRGIENPFVRHQIMTNRKILYAA